MSGKVYFGGELSKSTNASLFSFLDRIGLPKLDPTVMLISWLVIPSVKPHSLGGDEGLPSGRSMAGTSMLPNNPCATGANDRRCGGILFINLIFIGRYEYGSTDKKNCSGIPGKFQQKISSVTFLKFNC